MLGLIFIGLASVYVYKTHYAPKKQKTSRMGFTKANDILRRKSKLSDDVLNTTATSSACTLFLKNSAEQSMNDYANEFVDHHIDGIVKTCAGAFPTPLQKKIDKALMDCKTSTRETIEKVCYAALIEAKTASVATIVKPDAKPDQLDSALLLHLIADSFFTGALLEQPLKSLMLINALIDKEPDYLNGYKVKLMLLSMSSLNKEERFIDMFQETLEETKRFNVNDPDILEITLAERGEIFKEEKAGIKEYIEYLDQESKAHPTEWIYDYYKANALYSGGKGNYEQTVALIESALKKAPKDTRLKQTLENLKSDDEETKKHPFIISIGFSLNDL